MKQVTIWNTTSRMVLVPCNSGRNLFIPPRRASPEVPESEVERNARVEKLLRRKAIVLRSRIPPKKSSKPRAQRSAAGQEKES